jgi:hypothetical protein
MNLPPPPGPPGMYLRFLGGGSEAASAASLLAFVEPGGRPRRRPVEVFRGVVGLGAMTSNIFAHSSKTLISRKVSRNHRVEERWREVTPYGLEREKRI